MTRCNPIATRLPHKRRRMPLPMQREILKRRRAKPEQLALG